MSRILALVLIVTAACDAGVKPTPPAPPTPPVAVKPPPVPPVAPVPPVPPPPAPPPIPVSEHVLLASIDRGPCYGTCPVYTLTVYRDGKVEYVGKDFVKKKGKAGGTVTAEQLAALDKLFTDGKYLEYKSSYESYDATDAPSAKTAYRPAGATITKTVGHYYGDMHAPKSLTELEDGFDTIMKTERWIGTEAEREKLGR
ncbi:MAG TPA: DUF6438 domain-containing protein [Kofleriaceae bacterium]|nr:DUF6438 domain-containing protein [Kofleriaceae bacterium]